MRSETAGRYAFAMTTVPPQRTSRSAAPLTVSVATRSASDGERDIPLTNREVELLVALDLQAGPRSARSLARALYDDEDLRAGESMVKVYVHRLRRRLGDDAVLSGSEGYRLAPRIAVDACTLERDIARRRTRLSTLSVTELDALQEDARRLAAAVPEPLASRRWFAPIEARMTAVAVDTIADIAAQHHRSGEHRRALAAAAASLVSDPYHEPAHELAIRCHLALGDSARAALEYRRYRKLMLAAHLPLATNSGIHALFSLAS